MGGKTGGRRDGRTEIHMEKKRIRGREKGRVGMRGEENLLREASERG
jgi:hypothetical protein